MVAPRLILILGDQLSPGVAALHVADKARDLVVMAEVTDEARYVPHHPQKIALVLSAMRHFAEELRAAGWQVAYTALDDPENTQSITGELLRRAEGAGAVEVIATRPGEWRLISALESLPLPVTLLEDDRFLCSTAEFAAWAQGRKQWRMEWFYREMRRKTGLLMEGDAPAGGKWNYDAENRRPATQDLFRPAPPRFAPDAITQEVLALVEARFSGHFGRLHPFGWPVTRAEALRALDHFITHALPRFGDEQDAMLRGDPFLSHSLLSTSLNLGLLGWRAARAAAEAEWQSGRAPLNAVEGFIRQIIGWREYVRGVYFHQGPDYVHRNALKAARDLPPLYWGAPTRMECLSQAVGQTRDLAYAHHIQRLMVTGLFALLAGVAPGQVHKWYLAVYADAFEWVEAPNTVGMSQYADGGLLASKPYAASGAYIDRMSDYCGTCAYRPDRRSGAGACPFNLLYWDFLARHDDTLRGNPRMAMSYRNLDRIAADELARIRRQAADFLARLDRAEVV